VVQAAFAGRGDSVAEAFELADQPTSVAVGVFGVAAVEGLRCRRRRASERDERRAAHPGT
jgi:hypothetical protein